MVADQPKQQQPMSDQDTSSPNHSKENEPADTGKQASPASGEKKDDALKKAASEFADDSPLADKLKALEEEKSQLHDKWVRAVAETENIRKRAQRDQEELSKFAVTNFSRDMISVLENLIRASENIPEEARKDNELLNTLAEGVELTLQELVSIFDKHHIKRINPLNEPFDHNLHQAVVQIEQNDVPPGTVIQVVQAGYTLHDRLLRPAMVAVSKQGGDGTKGEKVDTTA